MRTGRLVASSIVGIAASTAVLLGGVLAGSEPAQPSGSPRAAAATPLLLGFSPGSTPRLVEELERQVASEPNDARTLGLLGLAYQQLARETGDPDLYPRAERVLARALRVAPKDYTATTAFAALAASRHRFDEALALAGRARRIAPEQAAAYGILGDANIELGRYGEAFAAFDRMSALKPSASAYARVAYGRELLGETARAVEAMKLAVDAAEGSSEAGAWARVQLGNLYADTGRLRLADHQYRDALVLRPGYPPALAGRGRVEAGHSRLKTAASLYRRALTQAPAPEYAVALGDLLARLGRARAAEQAYERASALETDFAANGGRNELETALFDLDHDRNLARALERARAGHRLRPSIEGEHVLAWALYKNGRCKEARRHSARALRLGTKDVGALYHRGLIERCLGNVAASEAFFARVRRIDPYFLLAPPSATRRTTSPADG